MNPYPHIFSLVAVLYSAHGFATDIEVIEVTAERGSGMVLPGAQSIDGPFGDNRALKDIARSVNALSEQQLETLSIESFDDLARIVPNSYSASGFGSSSLPSIRGQLGELFQDSTRRIAGNNGFGLPLSFNSVGQLDVVKGAAPVLLGSVQRNGGFVNLQSKKAQLGSEQTHILLSAGRWDRYRGQIDHNHIIEAGKSAVRVSYEHLDNNSYYDYDKTRSDSLYAAYRVLPNSKSSWDINIEYFSTDFTDNAGINRPTQALIDDGLYITGQGVQESGSTVPGAGAIVSPTGQVKIPRSQVFTHPDDINTVDTVLLHSIYRYAFSQSTELKNTSYYQYLDREEVAQNSFVEIIDGAQSAQNRLELSHHWSEDQHSTLAFDVRYNRVLGYSQFTTEADLPVDLTAGLAAREIPLTDAQKARLVRLREGVYVSPGAQYDLDNDGVGDFNLSDTTDSITWQSALVLQHNSQLTQSLSSHVGYRADYYDVSAHDPIAPLGTQAKHDSHNAWLHSAQLSFSYAINDELNTYLASSYNEATSNSLGGGFTLDASGQINAQNFATENTLLELGAKYAPENESWYADSAIFSQRRSLRNRDGSNTGIFTTGFELQAYYQTQQWWLNAAYSYLDARYDDSPSSQDSMQVADAFDDSRPDIIEGTGVGAPNFASFAPSDSRVQGIPEQTVALNAIFNATSRLSLGLSGLFTKHYPLDYLATVYIRDQYTVNLHARYAVNDRLALKLEVDNATNQSNWRPVFEGGYFGSTLVFPEQPINSTFTLTYRL